MSKIKIGFFNIFIILLTIYVLVALLIDTFIQLDEEVSNLLQIIDFAICLIFLAEFFYKLINAENRLAYLKWGWIDLLSSIPMLDTLRFGRIFKLIRLIRVFKAFKSMKELVETIYLNKAKGTISSALVLGVFIIIFSSISILILEDAPNSNIDSAEDALWWSYTTITTVGYGDKYPVTTEGRVLGVILMTYGISVFGILTAYLASVFVSK